MYVITVMDDTCDAHSITARSLIIKQIYSYVLGVLFCSPRSACSVIIIHMQHDAP